jgi:hypothetical protein
MHRTLPRICLLGLLCALGLPNAASAADGSTPGLSETLTGGARTAFESAKLLFANQDFAGALSKFSQAHDLSQDPRLLFNMAICEKNLHHYARMQTFLRQYRADAGSKLTGDTRAAVEDALRAVDNLVGTVKVAVTEPDATVSVDGAYVGKTPLAPVPVDLGTHTVTVAKDGFDSATGQVEVPGGSPVTLTLSLIRAMHVARLTIATDAGASVVVDGAPPVMGRFEGPLVPGTHVVRVTESGMIPYTASIDLHNGETRTVDVTLESDHHKVIWPWVLGGAALVAGAVVGGYFLFKPGPAAMTPPPPGSLGTGTVKFSSLSF